jgi:hypothetical protein
VTELGTLPRGGWGQVTDPAVPSLASVTPVEEPRLDGVATQTPGSSNGHIANCIAGCSYLLDDGLLGRLWTTGSSEGRRSSNPGSANDSPLDPYPVHTG